MVSAGPTVAAAAGMTVLALSLLASAAAGAGRMEKAALIVTQAADGGHRAATVKHLRRLVVADFVARGYRVFDGQTAASVPGATIIRVAADLQILPGAYVTRAAIAVRAALLDGDTQRVLARFDYGPGLPWRLAAHCPQICIDHEVRRRLVPLAARIAADADRRLRRLGRDRVATGDGGTETSVAFRRIDHALLPEIELYLRNFPGVTRIRRDRGTTEAILYRLGQDETAGAIDLSLRKMLHHLQLKARIARTGNSYVIEADPADRPGAASRDW